MWCTGLPGHNWPLTCIWANIWEGVATEMKHTNNFVKNAELEGSQAMHSISAFHVNRASSSACTLVIFSRNKQSLVILSLQLCGAAHWQRPQPKGKRLQLMAQPNAASPSYQEFFESSQWCQICCHLQLPIASST